MSNHKTLCLRATLLLTTVHHDINANMKLKRAFILSQGDALRWLYFCETGQDMGPSNPTVSPALRKRYLVDMWRNGDEHLQRSLASLPHDEREEVKKSLTRIFVWIKPFLDTHPSLA